MSSHVPEPLPLAGNTFIGALWDFFRSKWAVVQGFPSRKSNEILHSWPGSRGAYDNYTTHIDTSVDQGGTQYGIDPDDDTPSADYAIPTMGYNRCRVFVQATGGAGETLSVLARIWRAETAYEAVEGFVLASGVLADGQWHIADSDDYLGPWTQIKAVADGAYTLSNVTVMIHLWKE